MSPISNEYLMETSAVRKESETFSFRLSGDLRQWAQILGMESQRDLLPSVLTQGKSPIIYLNTCPIHLGRYSKISPGWQSSSLQIASRVVKRMALALPVLRMERLAVVMPILSASSLDFIFRLASMTSRLTIIMATSLNG